MTDWNGQDVGERLERQIQGSLALFQKGGPWADTELGKAAAFHQLRYERTVRSRHAFEAGLAELENGEPIDLYGEQPTDRVKFEQGWREGLHALKNFLR